MRADGSEPLQTLMATARPRLWRAFVAVRGEHGADDAAAEALAWGWEHGDRLLAMSNPIGYLYRVGLTRSARLATGQAGRRQPAFPEPSAIGVPHIEPGLGPALAALPDRQRQAVWLVHGCGWTQAEVAEALGISRTAVGTHVARALARLRDELEVKVNG